MIDLLGQTWKSHLLSHRDTSGEVVSGLCDGCTLHLLHPPGALCKYEFTTGRAENGSEIRFLQDTRFVLVVIFTRNLSVIVVHNIVFVFYFLSLHSLLLHDASAFCDIII